MKKVNIILTLKTVGTNEYEEVLDTLHKFVKENFLLLYEGAERIGETTEDGELICSNALLTRAGISFNAEDHYKYAEVDDVRFPSINDTMKLIEDIQKLIDSAAENIAAPFTLKIVEG